MIARHVLVGMALAALTTPAVAKESREETPAVQGSGSKLDVAGSDATPSKRSTRSRSARRAATASSAAFDPNDDGLMVTTDGSDGVDLARVRRHAAGRTQAKIATVLPPSRPATVAVVDQPPGPSVDTASPSGVVIALSQAQPASVATPPAAKVQLASVVLPPMRPSFAIDVLPAAEPPAAQADAEESEAPTPPGRRVRVGALPPARPTFSFDEAPAGEAAFVTVEPETAAGTISAVRVLPPDRPVFPWDEPATTASLPETAPAQTAKSLFGALFASVPALPSLPSLPGLLSLPGLSGGASGHNGIDGMITRHAKLNDVPEDLVHRVVIRESKSTPRAIGHGGALGLMQIKHATARSLGYEGAPTGLLDADTNLTYAVKYLAGAYRTAGGDYDQAVRYYARGYYYAAKARSNDRRGIALAAYRGGRRLRVQEADAAAGAETSTSSVLAAAPAERPTAVK